MKKAYVELWKLARPLYEKGRPMDVSHIEWMMKESEELCKKEYLDDKILMPLVILHDVGYSAIPKGNPFNLDMRRTHMREGAKIAEGLLKAIGYPAVSEEPTKTVCRYISIHDNWALGDDDSFNNDKLLGAFNDLDFMWMATPNGFLAVAKVLGKTLKEMIAYLDNDDKPVKRPFATKTTLELYTNYLEARRKEVQRH